MMASFLIEYKGRAKNVLPVAYIFMNIIVKIAGTVNIHLIEYRRNGSSGV